MKNVFFVCNFAADYGGNFIASLMELQNQMGGGGVNCFFILPNSARDKEWVCQLEHVVKVAFCDFTFSSLREQLNRCLEKNSIIHTHFVGAKEMLAIQFAAKKYNVPIVYHMHNRYGQSDNLIRKFIKRIIYNNVYFIGVSNAVYDDLCTVFDKKRCFCIPNAISLKRLDNALDGVERTKTAMLIFGTNYIGKGVDIAIGALLQVEKVQPFTLTIVSHDVSVCKEQIKKDFGYIPKSVQITEPLENVEQLYQKSHLFLAPGRREAFGFAVVEAAYCGCKVIASDIPGQNTMKGIPGVVWVKGEDKDALAVAILHTMNEEKISAKQQRDYIKERYSLKPWCDRVIEVYKKVERDE